MLSLNQIPACVNVVREGGFAAAARRLSRPPNFMSSHVKLLERELGNRLFHRSTRKLTMTAAGQALFDSCENTIADLIRAIWASTDDPNVLRGAKRVAAPHGFLDLFRSIGWRSSSPLVRKFDSKLH